MHKELDKMLRKVTSGDKSFCFEVFAFTMKRLCGQTTEKAWEVLADAAEEDNRRSLVVSGSTGNLNNRT